MTNPPVVFAALTPETSAVMPDGYTYRLTGVSWEGEDDDVLVLTFEQYGPPAALTSPICGHRDHDLATNRALICVLDAGHPPVAHGYDFVPNDGIGDAP